MESNGRVYSPNASSLSGYEYYEHDKENRRVTFVDHQSTDEDDEE